MTGTAQAQTGRRTNWRWSVTLIAVLTMLAVLAGGTVSGAQEAPIGLGTAEDFAVLAGTTITNTGPTTITGDVGLHPGSAVTGFDDVTLNGDLHVADGVALQAKNDLTTAYNDAAGRTPVTTIPTELGGQVLGPGVYDSSAGTFGITGTVALDAGGDPDALFVFQMGSTLTTASASTVSLVNGAQACNVYWQVGSSATLGTNSNFAGNVLALSSITVTTGVTVEGRALARNGAVTLDTDTITRPVCAAAVQEPTEEPTEVVTEEPTETPTEEPTQEPTDEPTTPPTDEPTGTPTEDEDTSSTPVPVQPPTRVDTGGGGVAPLTALAGLLLLSAAVLAGTTLLRRPARNSR